jgi:hypothetical protein
MTPSWLGLDRLGQDIHGPLPMNLTLAASPCIVLSGFGGGILS